jgi:hypothetical protein
MSDKYLDRAFPLGSGSSLDDQGMTLRDYFAAKAMQGLQANATDEVMEMGYSETASYAYKMANAMMEARKK